MSYIVAIETAVPEFKHSQESLIEFYKNSTDDETIKRKISVIGSKAAINTRYSVINDFILSFSSNKYIKRSPKI